MMKRFKRWLSDNGSDLLFWGCASLTLGNIVLALRGPPEHQGRYIVTAIVFGASAWLLESNDENET